MHFKMRSKLCFIVPIIWFFLACFQDEVLSKELQSIQQEGIQKMNSLYGIIIRNQTSESCKQPDNNIMHWAVYQSQKGYGQGFYGTKATMSVYALQNVTQNQLSSACIWIINGLGGPPEHINTIVVGWTIHPDLYKDNRPHLFTLWTRDSLQTTCCYNTLCGFVLANKSNIVPGSPIDQVSTYGGTQYDITLKVYKEKNSGNWWLYYGASGNYDKLIPVGYWPKSLFTGLAGYASDIHYGGVVNYLKGQHGPPMGSGHFADEGENKAASFTKIKEVDQDGNASDHIEAEFKIGQDRECYTATKFRDNSFFYGGPGQQCTD